MDILLLLILFGICSFVMGYLVSMIRISVFIRESLDISRNLLEKQHSDDADFLTNLANVRGRLDVLSELSELNKLR